MTKFYTALIALTLTVLTFSNVFATGGFFNKYLTKTEVIMTKFYTTALIALTLTVLTFSNVFATGGF